MADIIHFGHYEDEAIELERGERILAYACARCGRLAWIECSEVGPPPDWQPDGWMVTTGPDGNRSDYVCSEHCYKLRQPILDALQGQQR